MNKKGKATGILIAIILLILLLSGFGAYYLQKFRHFDISILFSESKGLRVENPVIYKGLTIGKVKGISFNPSNKISVTAEIFPDHKNVVRKNALWVIDGKPEARFIRLGYCRDDDLSTLPLAKSGAEFNGEISRFVFHIKSQIGCFEKSPSDISPAVDTLKKKLKDTFDPEKMEALIKEIETFLADIWKTSKGEWESYLEKNGPKLREKARRLIQELEERGFKKEAETLRKFFEDKLGPLESPKTKTI